MNAGPCANACVLSFDGDAAEVCNIKMRKARKPHTCGECETPIQPGQQYEYVFMIWEGEVCQYNTCVLCVEIREHFSCDGTWMAESLWYELEEHLFDRMTTGCLGEIGDPDSPNFKPALSAAAKAKVIDRWKQWKGIAA